MKLNVPALSNSRQAVAPKSTCNPAFCRSQRIRRDVVTDGITNLTMPPTLILRGHRHVHRALLYIDRSPPSLLTRRAGHGADARAGAVAAASATVAGPNRRMRRT